MTRSSKLSRRDFVRTASALAGGLALGGGAAFAAEAGTGTEPAPRPRPDRATFPVYEDRLQDRLWMWGHDSGAYDGPNGVYNIPLSESITMADAIRYMNIPNVCVIRGACPSAAYRDQFRDVKRVTWNLSSGSNASFHALVESDFALLEEMPNLIGFDLDDFFRGGPNVVQETEAGPVEVAPAALSLAELKALRDRMKAYKRPLDLHAVLYSHQLRSAIGSALEFMDTVMLWTWAGPDVLRLEENYEQYRRVVPTKPTLLGIYMWDFGNKRPMEMDLMRHQLTVALDLFRRGEVEGLVFHCTPLCNKGLEAVEYSKAWIADHADEKIGSAL